MDAAGSVVGRPVGLAGANARSAHSMPSRRHFRPMSRPTDLPILSLTKLLALHLNRLQVARVRVHSHAGVDAVCERPAWRLGGAIAGQVRRSPCGSESSASAFDRHAAGAVPDVDLMGEEIGIDRQTMRNWTKAIARRHRLPCFGCGGDWDAPIGTGGRCHVRRCSRGGGAFPGWRLVARHGRRSSGHSRRPLARR